ncbi:hypothetical protein ACJMK2_013419, partial [Sinanodonta woodiana]
PQSGTWDLFRETSEDNIESSDIQLWNKIFVITKIITCFILFVFVLGCGVISKSTLLLMVTNIMPPNSRWNTSLKTAENHFRYGVTQTEVTWIWGLMLVVSAPYVFSILNSLWRLIFKKTKTVAIFPLLLAIAVETLHSIGLLLFVFVILPNTNPLSGALLCLNICHIPSVLGFIFLRDGDANTDTARNRLLRRLKLLAIILISLASHALWIYHIYAGSESPGLLGIYLCCPILISASWWENFVPQGDKSSRGFQKLKWSLRRRRTKISFIANIWKLLLSIGIPAAIFGIDCENGSSCFNVFFFQDKNATLSSGTIGISKLMDFRTFGACNSLLPLILAGVNILSSAVCYKMSAVACKILAQPPSFALPLALTTPVTVAFVMGIYSRRSLTIFSDCVLNFPMWDGDYDIAWEVITAGIMSYLAFMLLTTHIWVSSNERMQREDKLFVKPMYCGILLDQGLLINRRKDEEEVTGVDEKTRDAFFPLPDNIDQWNPKEDDWSPLRQDDTPMIYMCATMWHENENEMTQILKSLFRMDEDQCARRNLQLFLGIRDPDYYEFEAHIFFDDAFEAHGDDDNFFKVNGHVKQLIRTINVAAGSVHNLGFKIPPPSKIDTPYGGQLLWRLPGGNKLIAHLKDKAKIRHRKRWSQVMYMYYFLGHKLMSLGGGKTRMKTIADNMFLLALDGDVDFQPSALRLLVDRMKRNPNVGAACGRIHPIGSGPMVWYQKFEYAVSHWLQKATEHTIGCVLCSPGCFSLFRGSSLMDDNVMKRYTTVPSEARHYVQYDQGEDRWLCTLLLQQGYRVEYCAASDALTYAPEGFYEFYIQRRRWTPSTMANILDLLMDWKNVTRKNDDISTLYIAYQMLLMISTILTPGTIFLMILGAISIAYPQLPLYGSMIINIIPVALFILFCYIAKSDTQLAYAAILSTAYSLVMMVVIVGLLKQAAENGFCSVTTIFLTLVAGIFVLAAFIHPQEFWCIIHGFLYFLAIPSMSMLLLLYSLGNLHEVSWGTRETKQPSAPPKPGEQPKEPVKKGAIREMLEKLGLADATGTSDYQFSFGNLFRCVCCPRETKNAEDIKLTAILDRLDDIESGLAELNPNNKNDFTMPEKSEQSPMLKHFSQSVHLFDGAGPRENPLYQEGSSPSEPGVSWIYDHDLLDGALETLTSTEISFWQELIRTYLFPLEGDKKKQEAIQAELLELRNKVCLFFILINTLFITIVFSLQIINESSGSLSIKLPCSGPQSEGESIEPISLAFTAVFGILLVIQLICMVLHRLSTFLHICAITEIKRPTKFKQDDQELTVETGLELVKDMQCLKDEDTKSAVFDEALEENSNEKRDLWGKIARRRRKPQKYNTLSQNFIRNFKRLHSFMENESVPQDTTTETSKEETETDRKLQTVRRKFNRFERKSIFTIVKMSQNDKMKKSIIQRGNEMSKRWKRIALRARLGEHVENTPQDSTGQRKITVADVVSLAMAEKESK